jgi:hypothetical protein
MRREQEAARIKGYNELLTASTLAAARGHLACDRSWRVFCERRHGSTESTFGSLEKTCSISVRLSDARRCDLEKIRVLSEVQNENGAKTYY